VKRAEQVDGVLDVVDLDPTHGRREHHAALGLQPGHPRWLADVVRADSRLVDLVASAPPGPIAPTDLALPPSTSAPAKNPDGTEKADNGADRWDLITPDDLFGSLLLGDDTGTEGLDALLAAPEVASIVVPDLYSAVDLPSNEPVELDGLFAGPTFAPCLVHPTRTAPPPPSRPLTGLHLDPTRPADLNTIITLQLEVTRVAERLRAVALLDVPPGLRQRAIVRWRSNFDSSHAAAYHPWLRTPLDPAGGRGALIAVNPAAIAAGAIARSELVAGVPRGPANLVAVGIVDVVDRLDDVRHAELHQAGIDVFRLEADGVRLTGARTLSNDRAWRQLSVRRLLLLIERSVEHQLQWTVFEPNDAGLRAGLRRMLDHLLDRLFAQGAFAGATPAQSWFVRVSAGPDLALEADRGQVVVEVGVAPSEPTEFIIVRVSLDADGAIETSLRAAGTPAAPVGVGAHG